MVQRVSYCRDAGSERSYRFAGRDAIEGAVLHVLWLEERLARRDVTHRLRPHDPSRLIALLLPNLAEPAGEKVRLDSRLETELKVLGQVFSDVGEQVREGGEVGGGRHYGEQGLPLLLQLFRIGATLE